MFFDYSGQPRGEQGGILPQESRVPFNLIPLSLSSLDVSKEPPTRAAYIGLKSTPRFSAFCSLQALGASFCNFAPGPPKSLGGDGHNQTVASTMFNVFYFTCLKNLSKNDIVFAGLMRYRREDY